MSLIIKKNTTFKIPRTGSGAPSGIPVASTASVNIAEVPYNFLSPFAKKTSGYEFVVNGLFTVTVNSGLIYMSNSEDGSRVLVSPNTSFYLTGSPFYTANTWQAMTFSDDDGTPTYSVLSTNSSIDSTTIPTTGWSPSITITAA